MSKQVIGTREQQLRAMREASAQPISPVAKTELKKAVAASLPKTSGRKPVKRKAKKRSAR